MLRTIDVGGIGEDADGHARARHVWEPMCTSARQCTKICADMKNQLDGARETLGALRVIVLQTDLELNRLDEVAALLASRIGKQVLDGAPHA